MRRAADTRGRVIERTAFALGECHQLMHVPGRNSRMNDEQILRSCHKCDRYKILARIEIQLRVHRGQISKGRIGKQQRVTVGRCIGDQLVRKQPSRAGAVVDIHLLTDFLAHAARDEA